MKKIVLFGLALLMAGGLLAGSTAATMPEASIVFPDPESPTQG